MTIRAMYRPLALLVAGLLLGACGVGSLGTDGASAPLADPRVDEALSSVALLEERIVELEEELDRRAAGQTKLRRRLDKVSKRLWGSLKGLREQLQGARAESSDASSEAAAASGAAGEALTRAEAAARDLTVLRDRFDYHLRQEGGG